ncbi:MAG: lipase [Mycobacteriales bacterium]
MSPSRRLLQAVALVLVILGGTALLARLPAGSVPLPPLGHAPQDRPGPVLLVPGYGGATSALEVLATSLRETGREATVVRLPGDGTGDLRASAQVLQVAADAALAAGAPSVDVIGYSAGGIVARLWVREAAHSARRVITLGSPHHGTELAAVGAAFAPGSCPPACRQLVPGSDLLDDLSTGDETPPGPQWLSVWTIQDEVVTPPESARLDGAVNVALQDLCPGSEVTHGTLPTGPVVQALVLQALSVDDVAAPQSCPMG